MFFTFPLAFLASLAIPALTAIYWLRNKHRRQPVSSLILWLDHRETKEGGRILDRLQTPLLFFLELLTIILLIFAAAGPKTRAGAGSLPLVVVLDDSFSMLAGGQDSFRARATFALERELPAFSPVQFVLAGVTPRVLGEPAGMTNRAVSILEQWRCLSPSADLEQALAFALSLDPVRSRILIITDRAPVEAPTNSRVEWWAFGVPERNVAFINASRTEREEEVRCVLEVANLSTSSAKTELVADLETSSDSNTVGQEVRRSTLDLAPNETRRILFKLQPGAGTLRARIAEDHLAIDNEVILLPHPEKRVRLNIDVRDTELRTVIEKALTATKIIDVVENREELRITDHEVPPVADPQTWVLRLVAASDAQSYLGPFVVNRSHPLTEGLSLSGVVWGADKNVQPSGNPVITAGDILLLTDIERPGGSHELNLQLRPKLSTLHETPNWPIMIWNLLEWRAANVPGIRDSNLRLGTDAIVNVRSGTDSLEVTNPSGKSDLVLATSATATIQAGGVGVHRVKAQDETWDFAVNALSPEESDLTGCESGRWGDPDKSADGGIEHRSWSWAFLLMAMLVMAIHVGLISRAR